MAERLDQALVKRGLIDSRERAQALIMEGRVYIFENKAQKPSQKVEDSDELSIRGELNPYVSRGGHKLARAMDVFSIDAQGVTAIDIGASTGGFTDVLLRAGAQRVYAVDVGYGQLAYKLRSDERVVVMERTNARYIEPGMFQPLPELGVTDVSFISLKLILPPALKIVGRRFVALIKPQFEAGRERVGKKGVVRDPEVHEDVVRDIVKFVPELGWHVQGLDYSPITGPEGNIEFLCDMAPGVEGQIDLSVIPEVVRRAHEALDKRAAK
ncbi:MAG: TlyA family RNA methyltransferase [Candidatus Fimadaptatus sp.]